MTDAPDDSSGLSAERGTRRPRVGDSGSPVGSTLSIILAVVAVVAGFLILRAITDDDSSADGEEISGGGGTEVTAPTIPEGQITVAPTTAAPTAPAGPVYTGATIAVANASGVGGSAGAMGTALTTEGYQGVQEPGNATGGNLDTSIVYYVVGDAAAQAVAQSIANDLGGVQIAEMPTPRPAEGGSVETVTVLLMLGTDAAGRTLADLSAGGGAAGGTTVVPPPAIITQPG
jgi:hypothetical protein